MVKNRIERLFTQSLKRMDPCPWHMKLQVNELAHNATPADFLVLTATFRYLVECKMVNLQSKQKNASRFDFARLTQELDLRHFDAYHTNNRGYVLLGFMERLSSRSDVYLVPIEDFCKIRDECPLKTITRFHAQDMFSKYRIWVSGRFLRLNFE